MRGEAEPPCSSLSSCYPHLLLLPCLPSCRSIHGTDEEVLRCREGEGPQGGVGFTAAQERSRPPPQVCCDPGGSSSGVRAHFFRGRCRFGQLRRRFFS